MPDVIACHPGQRQVPRSNRYRSFGVSETRLARWLEIAEHGDGLRPHRH